MKKITASTDFTTFSNHRAEPHFTFVKNGQKTIEGRLKKGEYANLKTGDHIVVQNDDETDSVEVIVKDVRPYPTLLEMLSREKLNEILPDIKNIDQAMQAYRQFYTPEQEAEFGVIAIEIGRV
ncbi:MAG: ASCH domain-containing protein [bacterium]